VALIVQGQIGKGVALLGRAVALQDHLDNDYERLRTMSLYAAGLVHKGMYRNGMALHEELLSRAIQNKQATGLGLARTVYADSLRQAGEIAAWLDESKAGLVLVQESGDLVYVYVALSFIGWANSFLGNKDEAQSHRSRAQELASQLGGRLIFSDWFAAADAEIALQSGDSGRALALAEQGTLAFRKEGRVFALGLAEQVYGLALARLDPQRMAEAEEHLASGLSVMEDSEQVLSAARLRLEWAHLCRRRGDSERAAALRAQAVAQFEAAECGHVIAGLERACSLGESPRA
jgi:hypothetical protein